MVLETCKQFFEGNASAFVDCEFAQTFMGGFLGGIVGILIVLGILIALIFLAAFYVYHSLAWRAIATKLKYKRPWLAWIPFANTAMRLQLGGFHWAWVFLYPLVIPIFILLIISHWRIFKKRKYPGWFSLSLILPDLGGILYLIIIGFVAWKDRKKMLFK